VSQYDTVSSRRLAPFWDLVWQPDSIETGATAAYQPSTKSRTPSKEEDVQQFLEVHPLLWSFLSPKRIIEKPPILSRKKADFAIVTSRKILYLVEIEKPQTAVWTKSGGMSSEVQKGIDQLKDWAVVVGDHRLALLSELGLSPTDIHDIRYLLVAGLLAGTSPDGIIRMKRNPVMTNSDFLFFDELGSMLFTLEDQLGGVTRASKDRIPSSWSDRLEIYAPATAVPSPTGGVAVFPSV
jgi:hypothetical protein